jgi:nucleoside-diphosphate-sugar epimerase
LSPTDKDISPAALNNRIIERDDLVLVTGATGFIGSRLVKILLDYGFRNLRCFIRPSSDAKKVEVLRQYRGSGAQIEVVEGNLLSRDDCRAATLGAAVIFHLAAGRGEKSYPDAFLNSVVTTRNLLEASIQHNCLKRFVNVSSFAVYTNRNKPQPGELDESCTVEARPELRGEAYCFAKVKQEELIGEYSARFGIPCVTLRPGHVYGPGNEPISGRVGISTFGVFLHLGGSNPVPFVYVDNCAEAIALAGLMKGTDGEVFNVVDDEPLSSRRFLRLYKDNVRGFHSVYVPHFLSYLLCYCWERYSAWSEGQLPPTFNRRRWHAQWKKTGYSNAKLKSSLGWTPRTPPREALRLYFESCRSGEQHA